MRLSRWSCSREQAARSAPVLTLRSSPGWPTPSTRTGSGAPRMRSTGCCWTTPCRSSRPSRAWRTRVGFDLAVLCDLRVAGRSARFAHPEVAFGDVMYGPLRELVGGSVARELVLTGRRLGAEEACTLGLMNRVVDVGQALDAGVALAVEIAGAPRPTLLRTIGKIRERAALTLNERVGATLDL